MQDSSAVPIRAVVLFVALLLGSTTPAIAQERIPSLSRGEAVRITSDLLPSRTGFFEGFRADTLPFRPSPTVHLDAVERLAASRSDRAGVGILLGIVASIGILFLDCGVLYCDAEQVIPTIGIGMVAGGIIGALWPSAPPE